MSTATTATSATKAAGNKHYQQQQHCLREAQSGGLHALPSRTRPCSNQSSSSKQYQTAAAATTARPADTQAAYRSAVAASNTSGSSTSKLLEVQLATTTPRPAPFLVGQRPGNRSRKLVQMSGCRSCRPGACSAELGQAECQNGITARAYRTSEVVCEGCKLRAATARCAARQHRAAQSAASIEKFLV